jgi:hypothetical protein
LVDPHLLSTSTTPIGWPGFGHAVDADGDLRFVLFMIADQLIVVHGINMITRKYQNMFWIAAQYVA